MKVGTKFMAVHNMRACRFEVIAVNQHVFFPYVVKAYEIFLESEWISYDFVDEVNLKWFYKRRIEILNS